MSSDKSAFLMPTRDDILHHHIIITTLVTSLTLVKLDVKGCFTHIFIDEAAQVMFFCNFGIKLVRSVHNTLLSYLCLIHDHISA